MGMSPLYTAITERVNKLWQRLSRVVAVRLNQARRWIQYQLLNSFLPVGVTLFITLVGFVICRMMIVEKEYHNVQILKEIERVQGETKELKATHARLLSFSNLNMLASRLKFARPTEEQIILIQ